MDALVAEACRKSDVLWISLPGLPQPRAAWHVWFDGAVYLVSGDGEQELPGLEAAETVEVTVRSKDKGAGWSGGSPASAGSSPGPSRGTPPCASWSRSG